MHAIYLILTNTVGSVQEEQHTMCCLLFNSASTLHTGCSLSMQTLQNDAVPCPISEGLRMSPDMQHSLRHPGRLGTAQITLLGALAMKWHQATM